PGGIINFKERFPPVDTQIIDQNVHIWPRFNNGLATLGCTGVGDYTTDIIAAAGLLNMGYSAIHPILITTNYGHARSRLGRASGNRQTNGGGSVRDEWLFSGQFNNHCSILHV